MLQIQPRDNRAFFMFKRPALRLFVNNDDATIATNRLARCVYAETLASSLAAVESLCVMIRNTGRPLAEIALDKSVFESLDRKSVRHKHLLVDHADPKFEMCLRAVKNMPHLPDNIRGATRFHRADELPEWARSIGSIAEADDLLFYK